MSWHCPGDWKQNDEMALKPRWAGIAQSVTSPLVLRVLFWGEFYIYLYVTSR